MKEKELTAVEKALQQLKDKSKHFTGNAKNIIQVAEVMAFKQGLNWAIDTIQTAIENERCEEEWRSEQLELELTKQQEQ
jgi:hypothetical protein